MTSALTRCVSPTAKTSSPDLERWRSTTMRLTLHVSPPRRKARPTWSVPYFADAIRRACFDGADLERALREGANLDGIDLTLVPKGALDQRTLAGGKMRGAKFPSLR